MRHEWIKYLEGMVTFKEHQGALLLLCIIGVIILWQDKKKHHNTLIAGCIVLEGCVIFPVTAVCLLKLYTPFYDWLDLQQVFPIVLLTAWLCTELFEKVQNYKIPGVTLGKVGKNIVSSAVTVVVLSAATVFHGFDLDMEVQENGVPIETARVFEALQQRIGEQEIRLAAPDDMLSMSRMFSAEWHPVYGRDLWSSKSASYIYSGYEEEYQYYDIFSVDSIDEERAELLTALINRCYIDCMIVPEFWGSYIGATPEYDVQDLYPGYVSIIKKDLITR